MPNGVGIYKANTGDNNYLLLRNDGGTPHPDSFVNVEMLETVNLIEGTNFLISEGNYLDGQTKTYLFKYVTTTGSVTSENVEVGYSLNDDRLMTHAYGPKVSGNLPTGYLIYTGYNLFSTADASLFDRGSFTLRANFVTGNGSMTVDMLEGAFSFISGEVAKTGPDAMQLKTPVVTMGIRGTTVAGKAAVEGNDNSFTLLQYADGGVGQISVSNDGGTQVLSQVGATTVVSSFTAAPPQPVILTAAQIQANYGKRKSISK